MAGSATLVDMLIEMHLVDEFHLLVYPLVLGKGKRLFKDDRGVRLNLLESKSFSSGVIALICRVEQ